MASLWKSGLELADATLDYLQRPEAAQEVIYLLEELQLPGSDQPLYNVREIGHMLDVKIVADAFKMVLWVLAIIVVGGLILLLVRSETRSLGAKAIQQGGLGDSDYRDRRDGFYGRGLGSGLHGLSQPFLLFRYVDLLLYRFVDPPLSRTILV